MKFIISILKTLLLVITPFLLFAFYIGLSEKIKKPEFKNLPTSDYVYTGVFLFVIVIIDAFTIRTLIKRKKQK